MYSNAVYSDPYVAIERSRSNRTKFGNLLRKYIEVDLNSNQKEVASLVREVYERSGKKKYGIKGCTLYHSNLNEIVNGHNRRDFGFPDEPVNLLWLTVTLVIYGALKNPWMLKNWIYEECLAEDCSNKGRHWLLEQTYVLIEELGFEWGYPVPVKVTEKIPVRRERSKPTRPLYFHRTMLEPILDPEVAKDIDEVLFGTLHQILRYRRLNKGPLDPITSHKLISLVMDYTSRFS